MVEAPGYWRLRKRLRLGDQILLQREIALRTVMLLLIRDHGPLYVEEIQDLGRQINHGIIFMMRDRWWCSEYMAYIMEARMVDEWYSGYQLCERLGLIQRQCDHEGFKQLLISRAGLAWIKRYCPRWKRRPVNVFGAILGL